MAKAFSQNSRPLQVTTPLGEDKFLLESFSGSEALSQPFNYDLTLLADPELKLDFDKLLTQKVTVTIFLPKDKKRYFHGIVNRLTQGPQVRGEDDQKAFIRFKAQVVPQFWLLKRMIRSRIFQHKNIPDILKAVMTGLDVDWKIDGTFEERDYCVQYRESDYDFACRLMEDEGIYYYFKHTVDGHKMVVSNIPGNHVDMDELNTLVFDDLTGGMTVDDVIYAWEKTQEVRSSKYTLWDYTFEMPDKNCEATKEVSPTGAIGTASHKLNILKTDVGEIYDFPGGFANRFDGITKDGGEQKDKLNKIFDDNKRTVGIRMDQETVPALTVYALSTYRNLSCGHKFTLDKHYHGNGAYIITLLEHRASMEGGNTGQGGRSLSGKMKYYNRFQCIPFAVPYRPPQITPKPRVPGTHRAIVVGPSDQEIFTDKYGRVKVQFFWDRDGKKDADSSCWIRVTTLWAGKQWGMIHIPRIGQEVIVDFIEGDPDNPIIVGSVYNADQMPPYKLPDNKTQSGVKTHSSDKGTEDTFNELRFEDKKDNEHIYFHAQKDFIRIVENNDLLQVGYQKQDGDPTKKDDGSQTIKIYKNRTEELETGDEKVTISKGNRTVTVSKGDDKHEVSKGKRDVIVEADDTTVINSGNCVLQVKKGNHDLKVDTGNDTTTVGQGDHKLAVSAGLSAMEAAKSMTLKVGGSSIKIEPAAITFTTGGSSIKMEAAQITIKSVQISVAGDAKTEVKSPMTTVSGDGILTLKGGLAKIN